MRLKYTFETMELDDQTIAVPVGDIAGEFSGVIKLNTTALYVFNLLREDNTADAIIERMSEEFDVPKSVLASDVHNCIELLDQKGLLIS